MLKWRGDGRCHATFFRGRGTGPSAARLALLQCFYDFDKTVHLYLNYLLFKK